jgi:hypothetical protein
MTACVRCAEPRSGKERVQNAVVPFQVIWYGAWRGQNNGGDVSSANERSQTVAGPLLWTTPKFSYDEARREVRVSGRVVDLEPKLLPRVEN